MGVYFKIINCPRRSGVKEAACSGACMRIFRRKDSDYEERN